MEERAKVICKTCLGKEASAQTCDHGVPAPGDALSASQDSETLFHLDGQQHRQGKVPWLAGWQATLLC